MTTRFQAAVPRAAAHASSFGHLLPYAPGGPARRGRTSAHFAALGGSQG
ncbi:hypothetical protein [Pseudarthrobacter sp. NPDC057230]